MKTYLSPAKINLFLHIQRRRVDGYHDLASLFQAIDLYDKLHITLSDKDAITCSDPTLPVDGANLVIKASDLFRRKTGLKIGIKAHLEKHIPHQAGLGGGSGNAATVLWALNELTGLKIATRDLQAWSAEIGIDIPFFFSLGSAYCTGRGEVLRDEPPIELKAPLWIIKPKIGLSTPAVFRSLDITKIKLCHPEIVLEAFKAGNWECFNDLEAPAFILEPGLQALKNQLISDGYRYVTMTGSGTAFFCLGEKAPVIESASSIPARFARRNPDTWF